jgi:hypothetical protein
MKSFFFFFCRKTNAHSVGRSVFCAHPVQCQQRRVTGPCQASYPESVLLKPETLCEGLDKASVRQTVCPQGCACEFEMFDGDIKTRSGGHCYGVDIVGV